jgi:hypothetical protein
MKEKKLKGREIGIKEEIWVSNFLTEWIWEALKTAKDAAVGAAVWVWEKVGDISDKQRVIYYGRRYFGIWGELSRSLKSEWKMH